MCNHLKVEVKLLSKSTTATQETPAAKLGFVVFKERTTYRREINHKMRVHEGRGCHSGPDQFRWKGNYTGAGF